MSTPARSTRYNISRTPIPMSTPRQQSTAPEEDPPVPKKRPRGRPRKNAIASTPASGPVADSSHPKPPVQSAPHKVKPRRIQPATTGAASVAARGPAIVSGEATRVAPTHAHTLTAPTQERLDSHGADGQDRALSRQTDVSAANVLLALSRRTQQRRVEVDEEDGVDERPGLQDTRLDAIDALEEFMGADTDEAGQVGDEEIEDENVFEQEDWPEEQDDISETYHSVSAQRDPGLRAPPVVIEEPSHSLEDIFDVTLRVPIRGMHEEVILSSDIQWEDFREMIAQMMDIRTEKLSMSYKFSTDSKEELPRRLVHSTSFSRMLSSARDTSSKSRSKKPFHITLQMMDQDDSKAPSAGRGKAPGSAVKGKKEMSAQAARLAEDDIAERRAYGTSKWMGVLEARYQCGVRNCNAHCWVRRDGSHANLDVKMLSQWALLVSKKEANLEQLPDSIAHTIDPVTQPKPVPSASQPQSETPATASNDLTTTANMPIPALAMHGQPFAFPGYGAQSGPLPFPVPQQGYIPYVHPALMHPGPYPHIPPQPSYYPYAPYQSQFPSDHHTSQKLQSRSESPDGANPTASTQVDDDPTIFPSIEEWLQDLDASKRGLDGQNFSQYAPLFKQAGFGRLVEIGDERFVKSADALQQMFTPNMPIGHAMCILKYARRDTEEIRKQVHVEHYRAKRPRLTF